MFKTENAMENTRFKISQYVCAVMLIVSSIAQVAYQLLTGNGWLHISWSPFRPPRHFVRLGYYK